MLKQMPMIILLLGGEKMLDNLWLLLKNSTCALFSHLFLFKYSNSFSKHYRHFIVTHLRVKESSQINVVFILQ